MSTWVGLGGFNLVGGRRALLQVGTSVENDVTTGTEVWAWYQYLVTDVAGRQVGGGETTRLPIKVRQGDRIQVLVSVAGAAYFHVRNLTTGGHASASVPVLEGGYDGSTAGAITERSVRLARFHGLRWHDVQVRRRDGSWHGLTAEAGLTAVHMRSGPTTISAPGPLADGFTTRWLGCGR